MGEIRDIDKIRCYIDLSDDGNNIMLNRQKIYSEFSVKITKYFEQYGLAYEILPLGGKGGGIEKFWDILKFAWENKEFFIIIFTIFKIIGHFPEFLTSSLIRIKSSDYPRAFLSLSLETNDELHDNNLDYWLGKRLINLKHISDGICNELLKDYSLFKFDQSFGLFIQPLKFLIIYTVPSEQRNGFNSSRIIRLFNSLKVKTNTSINYNFTRWFAIKRIDGTLVLENKSRATRLNKKYYLFLSTRVLSDYF